MATLDERVIKVRDEVDAFCDFDRTLITIGSHSKLHIYAVKNSSGLELVKKGLMLAYYGLSCLAKDGLKWDNTKDLEGLAKILKGVSFEDAVDYLLPKMRINPKIINAKKGVYDENMKLALLSKNDTELIWRAVEYLSPSLEEMSIKVVHVFGNDYEKVNGVYTGKVKVHVAGNKNDYFKDKPFIGDAQDAIRYKNHSGFIGI